MAVVSPTPATRPALSVNEACKRAGVCRRTMFTWIKKGRVQYVRSAGGRARIFADSLWKGTPPCAGFTALLTEGDDAAPENLDARCEDCGAPRRMHA